MKHYKASSIEISWGELVGMLESLAEREPDHASSCYDFAHEIEESHESEDTVLLNFREEEGF